MIVVMLLASIFPASAAMPMTQQMLSMMSHHGVEQEMLDDSPSHCEQMMTQHGSLAAESVATSQPTSIMMECSDECDCCSNACSSVFIHSNVMFTTSTALSVMPSMAHLSISRTIESFYRPPIAL
ncbi:hypothetical protein CW748_01805 [Alteromonadales bacterium alter-6D02]|nr:hypothetical protein CW748_01805 [Alteromonadales bacterium alter-6D02]